MQRVYNEGLDKTYDCYVVDGDYFFTKDVAKEIAVDCYDKVAGTEMFYDKQNESFVYIDRENFEEGYHVEYKGEVIYSDGNILTAYPIGYDWTLWQLLTDKAKEDSFEKLSFGDVEVVLDKKTKLGTKGCVTFSDGCQLVVSHEQDGFGQDWHYLVSLEKTNLDRDKGITRIDVIESCLTKNLDTAKRAGKEMVVNCQLSEGKSVVA